MRIAVTTLAIGLAASSLYAEPLQCDLAEYQALSGLTAAVADDTLTLTWDGDRDQEVRLRLTINGGTPTIRDLAVRPAGAAWVTLASNVTPEFRVVSGKRRISNQQLQPLRDLGVEITPEVIDKEQWKPFWDAPLSIPGTEEGRAPRNPDLPRTPEEIVRATATYQAQGCAVKTNGARLEITFPGTQLGVFRGRLQYTVYKGTNLIRQEVIAKTEEPSVAYKYDAGLAGLTIQDESRVVWRDTANNWQVYEFGGKQNDREVPLKSSNRMVIAEQGAAGSIAAFPPPHTFFWARELATNLGYSWYRKDSATAFSFGVRQAEQEDPQYLANFALYSARPGTWQRMAVYFYPTAEAAQPTAERALAFTHGDRFKALPGYQVMNHHYHMNLGQRLLDAGSLDTAIPDLQAFRALGINIVSQIDSVGFRGGRGGRGGPRPGALDIAVASIEGARRQSDKNLLVMPSQEFYGSPLGGHTDLLFSHPVYWTQGRDADEPLAEAHPEHGTVYHIETADDLMEMVRREDMMISMPHPRTKGSTGFPDAIKDTAAFTDPHYQGVGWRWGMGLDLSERRLSELRVLPLLDDMNNWVADLPIPPKYLLSISEVRYQSPGDEIYSSAPVSYLKLDRLPTPDDTSSVIQTLMRGDYFVTSGEVLIPSYAVEGSGSQRTISALVEWTFPLEFVEVVWGDGQTTDRQIISATDLPPMGTHLFQIPFDATGRKWVRFAAWDSAGNGALVQPVKLSSTPATGAP